MWLLTVILGGIVIWLINYLVNSQYKYWKKNGIPCSTLSPYRQIYQHLFTKKGIMQILREDYNNLKDHKFVGQFQMFTPLVMIRDADLMYRMCIKDFSHFVDRNLPTNASDLFTETLGNLTGDRWRILRHKLTPSFTSGKLKMMFLPIKENCDEVASFINKKIGQDIEGRDLMFKFVVNVIGNVSFGLKADALNEETEKSNEFLNVSKSVFKPSLMLMIKLLITITLPKVRNVLKFKILDEKIETFFRDLVRDIISHRERTGEVRNDFLQLMLDQKKREQEDLVDTNRKSKDLNKEQEEEPEDRELLDQLKYMQSGNENYRSINVFTNDCIVAQTFVFISGGSETVAATMSFVLFELTQNPTYQKKVQEEIDDVIARHGFTYDAIRSLTYMEQFINESMRQHTSTPFLMRVCTQNYNIPETDVVLEKGTVISLPLIGIMNDPNYFPDPDIFDPDHFKNIHSIHPGALLAFGIGPRMCIAKRLAMLEMKMLLTVILQQFNVKLSKKTKLPLTIVKSSLVQHVNGGVWVQFEKRNGK